jgi:deoxycytidine triphosphate deaminase
MILTDREIKIAIKEGQVRIDPLPDLAVAVSSTTIDLTLSDTFRTWPEVNGLSIRPGADGYSYAKVAKLQIEEPRGHLLLSHEVSFSPGRLKNNDTVHVKVGRQG